MGEFILYATGESIQIEPADVRTVRLEQEMVEDGGEVCVVGLAHVEQVLDGGLDTALQFTREPGFRLRFSDYESGLSIWITPTDILSAEDFVPRNRPPLRGGCQDNHAGWVLTLQDGSTRCVMDHYKEEHVRQQLLAALPQPIADRRERWRLWQFWYEHLQPELAAVAKPYFDAAAALPLGAWDAERSLLIARNRALNHTCFR